MLFMNLYPGSMRRYSHWNMQLKSFCVGDVIDFCDSWCFISISKLFSVRYSISSAAMCWRTPASFSLRGSAGTPAGSGAVAKKLCSDAICAPTPDDDLALNTLLRRAVLSASNCSPCAGVASIVAPGAKLLRPPLKPMLECRCADAPSPPPPMALFAASPARFVPDDERWKMGWLGRPGASDMREPDV